MMETKVEEDADTNMPGSWPVGKDFATSRTSCVMASWRAGKQQATKV
jgi:hypothetical protein